MGHLGKDDASWAASLAEKTGARDLAVSNVDLYTTEIMPKVRHVLRDATLPPSMACYTAWRTTRF